MTNITRESIVEKARTFLGAKWKHLGRSPNEMDCVGLLALTADSLEVPHDDPMYYERTPRGANFLRRFLQAGAVRAKDNQPKLARIAILRDGAYPCHCGIIGEDPRGSFTLIHAYALGRKVVEVPFDENWQSRLVAFLEFPGVE